MNYIRVRLPIFLSHSSGEVESIYTEKVFPLILVFRLAASKYHPVVFAIGIQGQLEVNVAHK